MRGYELKLWRWKMGWSLSRAARETGYSRRHYVRLEQDERDVSARMEQTTRTLEALYLRAEAARDVGVGEAVE